MSYFDLIRINKVRLLLTLLALIIFVSILINYSSEWDNTRVISHLKIDGNNYLDKSEILFFIKDSVVGLEKNRIVLADIENAIKRNTFIKNVSANFYSRNEIRVAIDERIPIAYIHKRGDLKYIDEEFQILPYRVFSNYTDLPIFYGNIKDSVLKILLLDFIEKIKSDDFSILNMLISEIHLKKNKSIQLISNDGLKIKFGRIEHINNKFKKLLKFWETKLLRTDIKNLEYLDISWKNKVIAKVYNRSDNRF